MMKVLIEKRFSNCFATYQHVDLSFDEEINKEFIEYLSVIGTVQCNFEMEKPFFRIKSFSDYLINGAIGNTSLRLLVPIKKCDEIVDEFKIVVDKYHFGC